MLQSSDWPCGWTRERYEEMLDDVMENWGRGSMMKLFLPAFVGDERARRLWARYQRMGASPSTARALLEANAQIDVRPILSQVQAPALIIHRTDEAVVPVEGACYMAEHIRRAQLLEQPGDDHLPWLGDSDGALDAIEEFVTGSRHHVDVDRVLATIKAVIWFNVAKEADWRVESSRAAEHAMAVALSHTGYP
jgi:pimeloyl-ACP methyl ester carboxylesterase